MPTRQAEVAATVYFAANELRGEEASEQRVLDEVKQWKQRRQPPIREDELEEAIRHLNLLRWYRLTPSAEIKVDSFNTEDAGLLPVPANQQLALHIV